MSKLRGDNMTLDLLDDWKPPEIIHRYEDQNIRSSSLRQKIALGVAETLRDSPKSRKEIVQTMSEWLGEECGENMLNAYSSAARKTHTISYLRLLALVHATNDIRLLQLGADLFGHIVTDSKHQRWIDVGLMADKRVKVKELNENCDREFDAALRNARKGCKI